MVTLVGWVWVGEVMLVGVGHMLELVAVREYVVLGLGTGEYGGTLVSIRRGGDRDAWGCVGKVMTSPISVGDEYVMASGAKCEGTWC